MKKIINGKKYNTETAELIGSNDNGYGSGDFNYFEETLYKKKSGEFFLHQTGGANSCMQVRCGSNNWSGSSDIISLDEDPARDWAEKNLDVKVVEKIFGEYAE